MRIARILGAVLCGVALVVGWQGPVEAHHDSTVHLELRVWFPRLDAEVQSSRGDVTGDVITESDLALDDPVVPVGAAVFRFARRHSIRFEGFALSSAGDTRVDRTFAFGGRTYTASSRVLSDFDARVFAGDYGFDVVHGGPIALGLTLGARVVDFDARLRAPDLGFASEVSVTAVVPAVGAVLIAHPVPVGPFASLAVVLRLSGLSIGSRGEFFDVDVGAEWLPLPFLSVRVGYRLVHGRGEEDDDRAKFDVSGPYAGVTVAF